MLASIPPRFHVPYRAALQLQQARYQRALERIAALNAREALALALDPDDEPRDSLLLLTHAPVYTVGVRGKTPLEQEMVARGALAGVPVVRVLRGGQTTYHGPGQLTAYPLLDLRRYSASAKAYMHALEQVAIDVLAGYGLAGERRDGHPGVWLGTSKIAAVGARVSRYITMHGLCLNVAMQPDDLAHYRRITPCGIEPSSGLLVSSMHAHVQPDVVLTVDHVQLSLARAFASVFNMNFVPDHAAVAQLTENAGTSGLAGDES